MRRALIVDDSVVGRMILSQAVDRAGWDVIEAQDGDQALAAMASEKPDVVFLDLLMPGLTGTAVLEAMRSRGIDLPVVVVTADVQDATRDECEHLGVHAYLNKPVTDTAIASALATVPEVAV